MLFLNFKRCAEGHTFKELHFLSLPWCLFSWVLAQPWSRCDTQATSKVMSAFASLPGLCLRETWAESFSFLLPSGRVQMPQRQMVGPAVEERRFCHLGLKVGLSPGLLRNDLTMSPVQQGHNSAT